MLDITMSDGDGAGCAAYRLHQGLKQLGLTSQFLFQLKSLTYEI